MINGIPGFVNFFILAALYFLLFFDIRKLLNMEGDSRLLAVFAFVMAGGYLSKFREVQGGGWAFNGIHGTAAYISFGLLLSALIIYAIFKRR